MPNRSWRDWFRFGQKPKQHRYEWSEELHVLLDDLAQVEHRTQEEVHADLIASALADGQTRQELWRYWDSLTLREQQVVAFICLGYTNREIAGRLGLSIETVKTHIKNVLLKLHIHSKTDLRLLFSIWDFSAWDH